MSVRRPFIRFVVHRRHQDSGERAGLFQAVDYVFADADAHEHLRPAILELEEWFNVNLRTPFRDEKPAQISWRRWRLELGEPGSGIDARARSISWIKATEHVSRLYRLKALVEEAGWLVQEVRTDKPGFVLYEDEHQVVAEPFAETPT